MRASRTTLLAVFFGLAAAVPALAQPAATGASAYPKCTGTPTKEDSEAAHGAYKFGKRKFDEGDYTTALNYFKDAYRSDCTKNELLIIIARAYELSGNRGEAVTALE